ncbi:MAG: hypothetical protein KF883_14370 [Thermomicrobiales bacterium]|nr:hypothetical protein [Thermomicrobiales bacterium]
MLIRAGALFLLLLIVAPVQASAQTFPVTPDPALCTLQPRSIDDVAALVDEASAAPARPLPTVVPVPFEMPEGFALVENVRVEVEKDLLRAIGCINTGDPLKVFATYTDRYVVELVERLGGMTDVVISGLQTVREIDEANWLQIVSVERSILLPDGRALVIVIGDDPADDQPPGARAFFLTEVLPGRWLIDEVVEIELPD